MYLAFLLAVCHDKDLILCLAHCHRASKFERLRRVEECSPILGLKAVPLADFRRTKVKEILALMNSMTTGRSVHFDGGWSQVVQWGWLPLVTGSRKHHVSLLKLVMDQREHEVSVAPQFECILLDYFVLEPKSVISQELYLGLLRTF